MDIKQQQREVIDSTNKMFREIYYDIVLNTSREWIRNNYREIHFYVVNRMKQQTKIFKRKTMDDDIKLIELSNLRLEVKNKINEVKEKIENEFQRN